MSEEISRIFDRIVSAKAIVEEEGVMYVIHDPNSFYRQLTDYYYQQSYQEFLRGGSPTQQEALALLIEKGIWSEDKEKEITTLLENKKKLKQGLPALEFKSIEKQRVLWMIKITDDRVKLLGKQKNALFLNTAEYGANIARFRRYLFYLTYDLNATRVWNDWDIFKKLDDNFVNRLLNKGYFSEDITEEKIRALARNDMWRSMWVAANKVGNIFDRPLSEVTEYQRILVIWSIIYDSVYEHPDCPAQSIIDNDILLDQWLEQQNDKRNKDKGATSANLNNQFGDATEVGIVVDTLEDAKNVYKLNDPVGKGILKARSEKIQKDGTVYESQLPDVNQELRMELNRMAIERSKHV